MVAHAILFIILPLAVAWFAGVTAYLPPYSLLPVRKTESIEPQFEAEVRAFLTQHSEPDADAGKRMVSGARGNALMNGRVRARCAGNIQRRPPWVTATATGLGPIGGRGGLTPPARQKARVQRGCAVAPAPHAGD